MPRSAEDQSHVPPVHEPLQQTEPSPQLCVAGRQQVPKVPAPHTAAPQHGSSNWSGTRQKDVGSKPATQQRPFSQPKAASDAQSDTVWHVVGTHDPFGQPGNPLGEMRHSSSAQQSVPVPGISMHPPHSVERHSHACSVPGAPHSLSTGCPLSVVLHVGASHSSPWSRMPLPQTFGSGDGVGSEVGVTSGVGWNGVGVSTGVGAGVGTPQPPAVQASHTEENGLTHAEPPRGTRHALSRALMLARVTPFAVVWQHATASGRPHVERAAQRATAPTQRWFASVAFAVARAQRTYAPWLELPAQSQVAAIAARAAATSAASAPAGSHRAAASDPVASTITIPEAMLPKRMGGPSEPVIALSPRLGQASK